MKRAGLKKPARLFSQAYGFVQPVTSLVERRREEFVLVFFASFSILFCILLSFSVCLTM